MATPDKDTKESSADRYESFSDLLFSYLTLPFFPYLTKEYMCSMFFHFLRLHSSRKISGKSPGGIKRSRVKTASGRKATRVILPVSSSDEEEAAKKAKPSDSPEGQERTTTPVPVPGSPPPVIVPDAPASMSEGDVLLGLQVLSDTSSDEVRRQLSPVVTLVPRVLILPGDMKQEPVTSSSSSPAGGSDHHSSDSDTATTVTITAELITHPSDPVIVGRRLTPAGVEEILVQSQRATPPVADDSAASDDTITISELGRRYVADEAEEADEAETEVDPGDVDLFDEALGVTPEDKLDGEGKPNYLFVLFD